MICGPKREESRLMREKVGAHYRKYREEEGENSDFEEADNQQEDPKEKWLKDVKEDPYIREAVNIVGDIIRIFKEVKTRREPFLYRHFERTVRDKNVLEKERERC